MKRERYERDTHETRERDTDRCGLSEEREYTKIYI